MLIPTDHLKKQQTIVLYSGDRIYNDYNEVMKERVRFTNSDPRLGDGSIDNLNLKSTDTGTYQCRVKKGPGVESKKIQLTVLVKPARTKCYTEGSQETGSDLILKCASQEGSPFLSYNWRKLSGTEKLLATSLLNKDTGELSVKNASQEHSGMYSCVAANRVGTDECFLVLNITPPINVADTIAGAVTGILLGLSLLAFLIFCCCKKHKEKKYEIEVHHDIREDVSPPKSRTSTARIYIGSNHSSLGSVSPSKMEGYAKSPYNQIPSEGFERPSGQNPNIPPSKFFGEESPPPSGNTLRPPSK